MIVGTAGHIDHGKTTLVRALTGVDTDRLKEEKARGISIELGYAYTPLANGDVLGFIDVPGHEKLVHTMAAGASGIDFGLLVVAVDDGVMPQTREHLAILALLGVDLGAIVITKSDRVNAARVEVVKDEVRALVADGFLRDAPVFVVAASQPDDPGVSELKAWLDTQAQALAPRPASGLFRLAIDRAFTLAGHGTVVTGTVHGGTVRVGDEKADLRLMPAARPVRVRSIHAQNRSSETGAAGQRCALNLPGVDKDEITRGDWVADARCFTPSQHLDVELRWQGDTALTAWTPLHVHLGSARALAHAVPLAPSVLAPGQSGRVQLVFGAAMCAMPGDRYIVRNAQASRTVGGGQVLDANAPDRKRRSPERLAWLDALAAYLSNGDLRPVLAQAPLGISERMVLRLGAVERIPPEAHWVAPRQGGGRVLIDQACWQALHEDLRATLAAFHAQFPDEPGADAGRLRRMARPQATPVLWQALLESAAQQELVRRNGVWWQLPDHGVALSQAEVLLAEHVLAQLRQGRYDPPWVRDLGRSLHVSEEDMRRLLRKLMRRGDVVQVVRDLFYHRDSVQALAAMVARLCQEHGSAEAAAFRDMTGLGRKRAIQILEFFDRVGYTRRLRDGHVLRADSALYLYPQTGAESLS
ncbi:selenocysteine-specific translation elongation factor [Bordetella holmesii]|uniref:Selenocysteine-specific elongation factor n=2 Tax=Bordetella holmesii TaxID=35814 RepID=A0A158M6N8_9BORD|nr:selenocysteine-specific translation elongation factor [Bordetella holmesii]AHV93721.1 selenocysteine-specific translation elongation factor [Bordetella holmesii ATCC 51541]EWM41410.1 selenocysteine-specific translation elongation factor [Bordetella holmesii 41130]EWM51128.1 selenocysteine-specific translation elongation factor [Bordetella holmesii 70147]AMD45403.1 translation elongation factor [Bordetella holmesii H558]AMD49169.1 translation elongation factor [Bordetella holmesii F627]